MPWAKSCRGLVGGMLGLGHIRVQPTGIRK